MRGGVQAGPCPAAAQHGVDEGAGAALAFGPRDVDVGHRVDALGHPEAVEVDVQSVELLFPGEIVRALGRRAGLTADRGLQRFERRAVLVVGDLLLHRVAHLGGLSRGRWRAVD